MRSNAADGDLHAQSLNQRAAPASPTSKSLWERGIAMPATAYVIHHEFDDTFPIADILLNNTPDFIHRAVGLALRSRQPRRPCRARHSRAALQTAAGDDAALRHCAISEG